MTLFTGLTLTARWIDLALATDDCGGALVRHCARAPFQTTIDAAGRTQVREAMKTIQAIWQKLYPADHEHKWMPLMWLPFMIWFFLDPYWKHASVLHWTWNTARRPVFHLSLPAGIFASRPHQKHLHRPDDLDGGDLHSLEWRGRGLLIYAAAAGGFNTKFRWVSALLAVELAILFFYSVHGSTLTSATGAPCLC